MRTEVHRETRSLQSSEGSVFLNSGPIFSSHMEDVLFTVVALPHQQILPFVLFNPNSLYHQMVLPALIIRQARATCDLLNGVSASTK